jgi:hypothetical protein
MQSQTTPFARGQLASRESLVALDTRFNLERRAIASLEVGKEMDCEPRRNNADLKLPGIQTRQLDRTAKPLAVGAGSALAG